MGQTNIDINTIVGSNANNGLNAGPLYLNLNNVTTNSNVNIGTGNLINKIALAVPTHMVKYIKTPIRIGRETEDPGVSRR